MNTVFFILGGALLALIVFAKIPGLEMLVRPIINLAFTLVQAVAANGSYWVIWLLKLLLTSHADLIRNLMLSAESIDPSVEIREQEA